jgi:hypothetical protein
VIPLGAAVTLAAALAIPILWNVTVWEIHRRAAVAAGGSA